MALCASTVLPNIMTQRMNLVSNNKLRGFYECFFHVETSCEHTQTEDSRARRCGTTYVISCLFWKIKVQETSQFQSSTSWEATSKTTRPISDTFTAAAFLTQSVQFTGQAAARRMKSFLHSRDIQIQEINLFQTASRKNCFFSPAHFHQHTVSTTGVNFN